MKKKLGFLVAVVACLVFAFAALSACGKTPTTEPDPEPAATLSQTSLSLVKTETAELTVTVKDQLIDVAWSVEDDTVVAISTKGKKATVRALNGGTTKINVKNKADGTVLATCEVTVTEPKLFINLPYGLVLRGVGSVATVRAFTTEELEGDIYWEVEDETFATVEYQGLIARVTAKKIGHNADGDTRLIVHYGDVSASIPLYIGNKA